MLKVRLIVLSLSIIMAKIYRARLCMRRGFYRHRHNPMLPGSYGDGQGCRCNTWRKRFPDEYDSKLRSAGGRVLCIAY